VAFPETIPRPERDPALDDKLQAELPGVLNWALEGLDRMMEQGRFTGDRSPGETQITWEKWCNSVKRFIKVGIEEAGDEELPKDDAYRAYQGFCEGEGIPVETQHKFTRDLKSYSDIEDGRVYIKGRGEQVRVFYDCQFTARGQQLFDEQQAAAEARAEAENSPTGDSDDGVTDY
jgi:putative DNA primase/helicase